MSRIKKFKLGDTVYDVGPNKTSELQNDAGFLTEDDAAVNVTQDANGDIKISGLAAANSAKPKWELIRDVTLEESTDTISVTTDDDGQSFELSAISYIIDIPAVNSGSGTVDMGISGHSISIPSQIFGPRRIGYHKSGISTATRSCNALCIMDGVATFAVHATENHPANNASAQVLMNNLCNSLHSVDDFVIDTLATYHTPSIQFPVGTRIRVFGKRV